MWTSPGGEAHPRNGVDADASAPASIHRWKQLPLPRSAPRRSDSRGSDERGPGACISQVHRLRGDRIDSPELSRLGASVEQQLVARTFLGAEQQQLIQPETGSPLEQADEIRVFGWMAKSTARRRARICRANPARDLLRCPELVFMGFARIVALRCTSAQPGQSAGLRQVLVRRESRFARWSSAARDLVRGPIGRAACRPSERLVCSQAEWT